MAPSVCPALCEHHPRRRVDCLVHDIGGNAPRCAGRELGTTQVDLAGGISRGFFSPEFGQFAVFDLGSVSKREREERAPDERSLCVDRRHGSGSVRATGYMAVIGVSPARMRVLYTLLLPVKFIGSSEIPPASRTPGSALTRCKASS